MSEWKENLRNLYVAENNRLETKEEDKSFNENREEVFLLQRTVDLLDKSRIIINARETDEAMIRTWSKIQKGIGDDKKIRRSTFIGYCSMAASVAVLFVLTMFFTYDYVNRPDMLVVMNKGKEVLHFMLPDSSKVWLGGGSIIKYPDELSKHDREVYLDGIAFFDVKKDNGRTFQVKTDLVDITVLGTRFDVQISKEKKDAEVVLESGSVRLNKCGEEGEGVMLSPGEMGRITQNSEIQVEPIELKYYTVWKDKYMNIESMEMKDVMFLLSKRFSTKIQIKGETLISEVFSARFESQQSLDEIFGMIDLIIPIQVDKLSDGSYLITSE